MNENEKNNKNLILSVKLQIMRDLYGVFPSSQLKLLHN